jgi:quinolinate synthase
VVVMYVNTSAEVKAETDYCCTSSNAVQVVEHVWREHGPETEILFGPDMCGSMCGTASATSTPGSAPRTSTELAPSIPAPSS